MLVMINKQDIIDAFAKVMPDVETVDDEMLKQLAEVGVTKDVVVGKILRNVILELADEIKRNC